MAAAASDDEDAHADLCSVCDEGGDLVCCDHCSCAFHNDCLAVPPDEDEPFACCFCIEAGDAPGDRVVAAKAARALRVKACCDRNICPRCGWACDDDDDAFKRTCTRGDATSRRTGDEPSSHIRGGASSSASAPPSATAASPPLPPSTSSSAALPSSTSPAPNVGRRTARFFLRRPLPGAAAPRTLRYYVRRPAPTLAVSARAALPSTQRTGPRSPRCPRGTKSRCSWRTRCSA